VTTQAASRAEAIDEIATLLVPRASLLARLLLRRAERAALSRTELGLLGALDAGPRRITELAESLVLAQPTVTQLTDRLQRRGLVTRERSADDGRVVLVSLTRQGQAQLDTVRDQYRALLRAHIADLPDEDVAALANATQALGELIDALQDRPRP
jgi:DNA-binding MarR family transcriptional regulator